jgi:Baseplate J-like protein
MPLIPPSLDDRSFDDLVEELIARIPAHTPEWTNPRQGDPGRTLIELFAWLGDALLYRANLIPERQRLAFLRLLGIPLRPAQPARGLVAVSLPNETDTSAISMLPGARIEKPLPFETLGEVTVLPVAAEAYYKRRLTPQESEAFQATVTGLEEIYEIGTATPYVTTPVFVGGAAEPDGFDPVAGSIDRSLWLALLAPKANPASSQPAVNERVRQTLGGGPAGPRLINVGFVPEVNVPEWSEPIPSRTRLEEIWDWEVSFVNGRGETDFITLDVLADSTVSLTRPGVVRLALPRPEFMGVPSNDVRTNLRAGVGLQPPRLDDPAQAGRLVTWLRFRPRANSAPVQSLSLSWMGVNAVEIDQRQTFTGRVVGVGTGAADQEHRLSVLSVEPGTLQLQVEEADQGGYVGWERIEDLAALPRDPVQAREARVFTLDSEAGLIRFGDGVRGKIPATGARIRVALMRAGGGRAGNLPAGSLTQMNGTDLERHAVAGLKVLQPVALDGGEDAEALEQAERRIPDLFRHRDRAVTADDYRRLALETPGLRVGRVEVLPGFKPQQRMLDVPGVVSVMALPLRTLGELPDPRPDRPFIEAVFAYLDARRPLATELYVIGCDYVPLGLGVGVTVRDGFGHDQTLQAVREALRRLLWPLPPGGLSAAGWPLGRSVRERELDVEVARVPGVGGVIKLNLFRLVDGVWQLLPVDGTEGQQVLDLREWQLPELLAVVAQVGDAPASLKRDPAREGAEGGVGVPVVPEVC